MERFTPGDRVVVAFNIACGACWFCRRGETQLCDDFRNLGAGAFGGSLGGAQAASVRVPTADVNLLRIPDGMDDERALFVGDILTTGLYAASIAEIEPGSTVAVVGWAPWGSSASRRRARSGPAEVFAIDLEPRAARARRAVWVPCRSTRASGIRRARSRRSPTAEAPTWCWRPWGRRARSRARSGSSAAVAASSW